MFCPLHSMTIFWVIAKVFQFCRSHISTMYFGTFLFFFQLFLVAKREVLVLRQLIHKRECILDKFCIIEFCWYLWASEAEQNFQICVKKINFHTKGYDSYRVSSYSVNITGFPHNIHIFSLRMRSIGFLCDSYSPFQ